MSIKFTISNLRLSAVLAFIIITLNPVFAGDLYNGVRILVGVVPEKQGMETKIDTLIYNLLVFEFERYGLITDKIKFEPNDSLELILSSNSESGLAVICSYTTIGRRVLLDIELYDSRTMLIIASATTSADLDLAFDKVIFSVVSELISEADEELKKRVVKMDYKGLSTDVENDISEEKTEPEPSVSVAVSKGGLEVFLNAGVSMGVGAGSDILLEAGVSLEFALNYWFLTSFGFLGPGVQISANLYPSADATGEASLIMAPMGFSVAYFTPVGRLFSLLIQIGSGPSLAVLVFEGTDPLVKVIPYISGAVGLSFNFRRSMSIGLKTAYSVYFEDIELLTTLTPSIYVSFRSWD